MITTVPVTTSRLGERMCKTVFDRGVAAVGVLVTAPLAFCIAVAIRGTMGAPAVFTQTRPGRHGRPFRLHKFRTMRDPAPGDDGSPTTDSQRLTRLGRFLRSTSLDEIPQLWNVLRGDMSLVGPRPLLMEYLERYTPEQARRHDVLPGITGWAQVKGRNSLSWEEKFALDVWYVDNWSLALDVRILALTALRVLQREGISQQGHATMPVFMGSPRQEASP